jgi:acetylornithine deacetylase/succinyl-diaminopimelate desuccinylase-like protein
MTTPFQYAADNGSRFIEELKDLLRIPSISTLTNHKGDIHAAAEWLRDHCLSLGMTHAEVLPTSGNPIVYAEWMGAGNAPTVLIYGHYDVQPVDDPRNEWRSHPFEPVERNGNLYARGAIDDKGQLFLHLKVFESFMQTTGTFPLNVKVLLEGEEETGSGSLLPFIQQYRDQLGCDVVVISDTGMLSPTQPAIIYGLRGLIYTEIEVIGPTGDLHSGAFGGAVHNPIQALVEILAQLHDENGRVTIPGFYDRVRRLSPAERQAFADIPETDEAFRAQAGVPRLWGEPEFTRKERVGARPTLEINGIVGGWTGEGQKTVIPARALAKISCRLVPDQNPHEIQELLKAHLMRLAPDTVRLEFRQIAVPSAGSLVELDSPPMRVASIAYERVFGVRPVFKREGGSIPVVTYFQQELGVSSIMLGFGLPDDNLHAPNEKITLSQFHKGIQTLIHFYGMLPDAR